MGTGKDLGMTPSGRVRASDEQSTGAAHTPELGLPWRQHASLTDRVVCGEIGEYHEFVADLHTPLRYVRYVLSRSLETRAARAAFIVRACNSHADLLEALKEIQRETKDTDSDAHERLDAILLLTRAAIAKTEGRS